MASLTTRAGGRQREFRSHDLLVRPKSVNQEVVSSNPTRRAIDWPISPHFCGIAPSGSCYMMTSFVLPPLTPMLVIFALAFLAHDTLPHNLPVGTGLIPTRPRRAAPRTGDR